MRKYLSSLILAAALCLCSCTYTKNADPDKNRSEFSGEYTTKTGKTILVSESHPVGQSLSTIEIQTQGFEHNYLENFEDMDPIANIFLADIDANGFDEIYIITVSQGSGSYGNVLAFASNRDKSISMIHLPEIDKGDKRFQGYMGHDVFKIEDRKLVRTFPVYNEDDSNRNPSGGKRKLIYGLYPGEAMWQLVIERSENWEDMPPVMCCTSGIPWGHGPTRRIGKIPVCRLFTVNYFTSA